jgi:N-ethylmaleimide reductase
MSHTPSLFDPIRLGALRLSNRIVMAPLTRSRALPDACPGPAARLYYAQRASAGMIVSEGVCISAEAVGNPRVPGIWTDRHISGWSEVTAEVHAAGGTIVAQLWHTGRASHPSLQPGGQRQVGPSAVAIDGTTFARGGLTPHITPRALDVGEISGIVGQYATAARNARAAGFDGVELHAANGYLIDQFLQDSANRRADHYGGSIENRARLLLEVVAALTGELGPDRVGVRLSPSSTFQGMADSDPEALFEFVLKAIAPLEPAYLHIVEPGISGSATTARAADGIDTAWVRKRYTGNLIGVGSYTRDTAAEAIRTGQIDAVAFGRSFLANPDLPARFLAGASLSTPDRSTFYTEGNHGYIDYPSLEAERLYADLKAGRHSGTAVSGLCESTPLDVWTQAWAADRAVQDNQVAG